MSLTLLEIELLEIKLKTFSNFNKKNIGYALKLPGLNFLKNFQNLSNCSNHLHSQLKIIRFTYIIAKWNLTSDSELFLLFLATCQLYPKTKKKKW